jgi:hypothetical protein
MFGLVKRAVLLECEKSRVELRLQVLRLEKTLNQIERDKEKLVDKLDLAAQHIAMLERERDLLLQAAAGRSQVSAEPPREPKEVPAEPETRSLTGLEAVARAMEHRNKRAAAPAMPRVTEIFANASRRRRAAEAAKAAKAATQQETGTGA